MPTWLVDSPRQLALDGDVTALQVGLTSGKLRVIGTDGTARLDVTKIGSKGVTVTHEGTVLTVRHEKPQSWSRFLPLWWMFSGWRKYHAHVTIAVPSSAMADLTMISGSVVASGLREGATVDVTSGSITLMGLGSTVRAKTVSGSIQAMGVAGDLTMETVSGEITLAESSADRVFAKTISGSVTCDLDNPRTRDVRLETMSGEITVRVPDDADLDVQLSAISGRVTSAFRQVQVVRRPGIHAAAGRVGTGQGILNAHAVSGSVSLLARPIEDFTEPPREEDR